MKKFLIIFSLIYSFESIAEEKTSVLILGYNKELSQFLEKRGYKVDQLNPEDLSVQKMLKEQKWEGPLIASWTPDYQKIGFSLYRFLKQKDYNIIFFPEQNGYGYYLTEAKKQGYGFEKTILVSYITEPAEWLWDISNITVPAISSYLQAEGERKSVEQADVAIIPSNFAYNLLKSKGWIFPDTIKILHPLLENEDMLIKMNNEKISTNKIKEIVFIQPNSFRYGYDLFINTVKKVYSQNPEIMNKVKITILHKGPMKEKIYDNTYEEDISNLTHLFDTDYLNYIKDNSRLIIFTSREELGSNEEYKVLYAGAKLIGMKDGFLEEIIDNDYILAPHLNTSDLAKKIIKELEHPSIAPHLKKSKQEALNEWENALNEIKTKSMQPLKSTQLDIPFVSVCITHFNRVEQLMEALNGFNNQTYKNFEVIVMDDGSKPEIVAQLKSQIEPLMIKNGWRIFYQENKFISQARNNLVNYAKGPYILLFEDDDIPLPDTIERFVRIKQKTQADIVNTNLALAAKNKFHPDELWLTPGSYVTSIIGENHIGYSAIALTTKEVFQRLNGYLDSYGFLYSDYEFYLRAALNKAKIVTSIEPTYIYNFVGQDHHVYEAHRAQFYQTRVVLNSYKHLLPKELANIPFWMYSIEQENESLIKKNKELNIKIEELSHETSIFKIISWRIINIYNKYLK